MAHVRRRGKELAAILSGLVWNNKLVVSILILLLLLAVIFAEVLMPAAVIVTLGVIASFSTSYKRVIRIPPAVELVTFTTVIVSLAYGPVVGAIYAAIVTFTAEIMTNALDAFIITFVPSRVFIALIAGFVFSQFQGNIVLTGLVCSIIYNAIAQPLYIFMADVEMRMKSAFFIFLNVGSNFIIFAVFGNLMVRLLGIQ